MEFYNKVDQFEKEGKLPPKTAQNIRGLRQSFEQALKESGSPTKKHQEQFESLVEYAAEQIATPYPFAPFHKKIDHPFHTWGVNFFRPSVDFEQSKIVGWENIAKIDQQIKNGDNVILYANHQTEIDPQILNILLEKEHQKLAQEMIFVAGDRVLTDPIAVPFSKGCNLLCIYSKKYMDFPPEKKGEKLQHNRKTMRELARLFKEGGKCVYVAPSGGRDRPNKNGEYEIAPFDGKSVEMFILSSRHSSHKVHFYPLSLLTHSILPPPAALEIELEERRVTSFTPLFASFGEEIDIHNFPEKELTDKNLKRQARADFIWQLVKESYDQLNQIKNSL